MEAPISVASVCGGPNIYGDFIEDLLGSIKNDVMNPCNIIMCTENVHQKSYVHVSTKNTIPVSLVVHDA